MATYYRKIERDLISWSKLENRKPLILNGARQVGKTYVLNKFAKENFRTVHYLNFESDIKLLSLFQGGLEPKKIIDGIRLHRNIEIDVEHDILFFDEIQACPLALTSLKYFCEKMPSLAICAAGSLLGVRLSKEPFPVGKVHELNMFPLDFSEFLLAIGEVVAADLLSSKDGGPLTVAAHATLWELWRLYLVVGGLPEVIQEFSKSKDSLLKALTDARQKQILLINEYLKDMAKHAGQANALHLERIFRNIPAQLAKVQEDSVKRFRFTGVVPGISQYLRLASAFDWLEGSGLIYKIPIIDSAQVPLRQHVKESIFKAYIFDTGILGALGDIPIKTLLDFEYGTYKGYVAENFALQALKASGVGTVYGWSEGTAEVEFIVQDFVGPVPIEVKSGSVRQAKSLTQFVRRYKPEKAFIFGATLSREDGVVRRRPLYLTGLQLGE